MTRTEKEAKEIKDLRNGLKRQVSELARLVFEDALQGVNEKYGMHFEVSETNVELRIYDANTCEGIDKAELWCLDSIFEPVNFIHPLDGIIRNVNKAKNELKNMRALFFKYKKLNSQSK